MAVNVRLFAMVGPATTAPFFFIVIINGPVPPEPVTVMSRVEPGQSDAGGVIVQVGIGVPVRVVLLSQTQVVEAVPPWDESETCPE